MKSPTTEAPVSSTHRALTLEERSARLRSEAREAAANSVRRIRLEGAAQLAVLEEKYAHELAATRERARSATRRMTSGFSIAFLVGAASIFSTFVDVPRLAPDVAFERYNQFEVAGLQVAVSAAEAESELATETVDAPSPKPHVQQAKSPARPISRPLPSATVDPCTGDAYDPLNFCL